MQRTTAFYLPVFFLFAGLAAAQPVTETCSDGRVMAVSPFNPNPCETFERVENAGVDEQVNTVAASMPDGFLAVYGPPPSRTGQSLADRVARVKYEQDMRYFGGVLAEPVGFDEVADFYERWGFGRPSFYKGRYGEYCRWPNAPFRPAQATMFTAVHGAGVVVASWQVKVIQEGHVLTDLHAFVPPRLRALNDERLAALRAQE